MVTGMLVNWKVFCPVKNLAELEETIATLEMEVNTREDFLRRNEQWCEWVLKKANHKGVGRLMEPGTSGKEPRMCGVEEAERELCGVSETVCEP